MKNPDEVLLPSCDLLLVTLREDEPGHCIPFALLDDLLLNPPQRPVIETLVSGSLAAGSICLTHPVRSPIASRMDWVSSSDRFPFNLRSST